MRRGADTFWRMKKLWKLQISKKNILLLIIFVEIFCFVVLSNNNTPSRSHTLLPKHIKPSKKPIDTGRYINLPLPNEVAPPECIMNGGKPVLHEADAKIVQFVGDWIDGNKRNYDSYPLPEIETIEGSFYFRVESYDYAKSPLLRAWNETFKIRDHQSIIDKHGSIWGSTGLEDEIIVKAMDHSNVTPAKIRILDPGKYTTFSTWASNNFGHFVHDHASKIAWMKALVTEDTKFILPVREDNKMPLNVLNIVDEKFVQERVVWVDMDETVHVSDGSLTVMIPKSHGPFPLGFPQTATVFTEYFRRWLEESHWSGALIPKNKGKVVYYKRRGSTKNRLLNAELEELLIQKVRDAMKKRGKSEKDLVIFTGKDENGQTLSLDEQFSIFSSASTVIGTHGSGLTNIIWMDPRCNSNHKPKILEICSSSRTPKVQGGSAWGYWWLFGSLPWIDYHQLYYAEGSTETNMLVDPVVFEEALNKVL